MLRGTGQLPEPAKATMTAPLLPTRFFSRQDVLRAGAGLCVAGVAVSLPHQAQASDTVDDQAMRAFQAGRWQDAADQAARSNSADNQAFAARALLAGALLATNSAARLPAIAQAKRYAEAALATAPRHVEGRLQLATALGLQARAGSPARAFARGLPQRVRRLLDSVARDAPSQAWAFALLGGWHLEGLRIGGAAARAMLGCDLAQGKAAFSRAMRLDPTEASTPFYFAASLLALSPIANATEARALLAQSAACPDRDAFQTAVKARSITLGQTIDRDGPARAARLALGWL
jgi:tetratricopeptide (TPR) repeat protein